MAHLCSGARVASGCETLEGRFPEESAEALHCRLLLPRHPQGQGVDPNPLPAPCSSGLLCQQAWWGIRPELMSLKALAQPALQRVPGEGGSLHHPAPMTQTPGQQDAALHGPWALNAWVTHDRRPSSHRGTCVSGMGLRAVLKQAPGQPAPQ